MRENMDMETKQPSRPSFDGPTGSPGSSASGASALRRLTRSPSHRLSLRRNSTSSSVSGSSSIVSAMSDDVDVPPSCVTRDTGRDECGLHRFIVWAAIKRNECRKMTPEEKRECPLLRCRKRFPNHELMLQHLYTCDQLAVGEYWCYDCGKVERFSDAKCKRCLGHPSKRRKIMSMAKHFFNSLGHKSKSASLADLGLDIDEPEAPPSYASLLDPPQAQAELFSNEIHEIDSHEIQLPTIPEDVSEPDEEEIDPLPEQAPDLAPLPIQPQAIRPAELESAPILTDSLINWTPLPETVVPADLFNRGEEDRTSDRPVLQLYTHGLEQYRAQAKKRSKYLAPSSSVRSTASTSSTNSTLSTFSTASYNISPMSEWSGAWQRSHGFESTLTSPADDLVSPGGLLPTNPFASSCKASIGDDSGTFEKNNSESFLSELPADDIPMLDTFPTSDTLHDTLGLDQSLFPFDTSVPTELTLESNLAMTDTSTMPLEMPQIETDPAVGYYTNPHSLVGTAWEALEMHITDSMAKLQQISKNHLVNQIRNLSPHSIARYGLEALTDILEGRQPNSPVKLLCFVHLAYALSIVVFEQDATNRSTDLFGQALSYSTLFSRQDRQAYVYIVNALWKPATMSDNDVLTLLRAKASPAVSRSGSLKGKEREVSSPGDKADSLAFVAQYFLDELEYAAVQASNDQPIIQTSDLYTQHLHDKSLDVHTGSPFVLTVIFMLTSLSQRYSEYPDFINSLKNLQQRVNSNSVSTTRRLDLELMRAGKLYLPSNLYFDDYITYARSQVDQLYKNIPNLNQRSKYYRHGIKLVETMIGASNQIPTTQPTPLEASPETTALDSLDEFIESLTPNGVGGFDFTSFDPVPQMQGPVAQPPLNFSGPMPDLTIDPCTLNNTQLMPTPEGSSSLGGLSTAATSPPSPSPASSSKVESNSCCEICGYRPKGDPRWFGGSMAKHKKLQHATTPPKIYRCPFPGCTSQYKNRPDNLRQHQIEKGHFVEGQAGLGRRPAKRKKTDE